MQRIWSASRAEALIKDWLAKCGVSRALYGIERGPTQIAILVKDRVGYKRQDFPLKLSWTERKLRDHLALVVAPELGVPPIERLPPIESKKKKQPEPEPKPLSRSKVASKGRRKAAA